MFGQEVSDLLGAEELQIPEIPWSLLAPVLVMALGAILLVTLSSVFPKFRSGGYPAAFTILTSVLSAWFTRSIWLGFNPDALWNRQWVVAEALVIDSFTVFVWGVICLAVFLSAGFFDGYLRREGFDGPDWYVLMMLSAAGGMLLAAAHDLILMFLAVEILSIAVYVLAGLHLRNSASQEAAFKYFLLGAMASAFMLYGIALVYGATGSTHLLEVFLAQTDNAAGLNPLEESSLILVGMALLLVGFAFKVAAVPFHMWTPDVYQGAPTPVTGFMASAVKAAAFAGMFRVFWEGFAFYQADWRPVLAVLAVASVVLGSLLALPQRNVKRMLAMSSIVHAGFILIALYSVPGIDGRGGTGATLGVEAFLFYLLAYTLMTIGSFGVLSMISGRGDNLTDLDNLKGLASREPLLAGLMVVFLFGQAGIPFTAGFVAKFRVIAAAAANEAWVVAGVAMLAGVVSAVLYLRVVVAMFLTSPDEVTMQLAGRVPVAHAANDADGAAEAENDGEGLIPYWKDGLTPELWNRRSRPALAAAILSAFGTLALGVFPDWGSAVAGKAAAALTIIKQVADLG